MADLGITKMKNYIKNSYQYKYISPKNFEKLYGYLDKISLTDPFFSYENRGKLLLKQGRYQEAYDNLVKAQELKDSIQVCYALYKSKVMSGEVEDALSYLEKVQSKADNSDFSLPLSLLRAISNLNNGLNYFYDNYPIILDDSKFCFTEFKDDFLKENYPKIIEAFNKKNFKILRSLLVKCQSYVDENGISVEFNTIICLVDILSFSLGKTYDNYDLDSDFNLFRIPAIDYVKYLFSEFVSKQMTLLEISQHLRLIIILDPSYGQELLKYCSTMFNKNGFELEYMYLKNKVSEELIYQSFDEEQKEYYWLMREDGALFNKLGDLTTACEVYGEAYQVTEHPVFAYYLGKTLYRLGNYGLSKGYLADYLSSGSEKFSKCLVWLKNIAKKEEDFEMEDIFLNRITRIDSLESSLFEWKDNESENEQLKNNVKKKKL